AQRQPAGADRRDGLARLSRGQAARQHLRKAFREQGARKTMMKQKIFSDFAPRHAELWGRHTLKLGHSLAGLDMFNDSSLAALIDTVPANHLAITTMAATGHDNRNWKYCDRTGLKGADVLEAVKKGRLWINITSIHEVDPYFATLLERMYEEL